jgi:hypothetical protein
VEVHVSAEVAAEVARVYGPERSADGAPSEWDFWSGPLAAAVLGFRDFESLPYDHVPQIRRLEVVDAVFGVVTFVAVLLPGDVVEIAAFATDADYWNLIEDDPDD